MTNISNMSSVRNGDPRRFDSDRIFLSFENVKKLSKKLFDKTIDDYHQYQVTFYKGTVRYICTLYSCFVTLSFIKLTIKTIKAFIPFFKLIVPCTPPGGISE
jgi:hypothetical protein